MHRQDAGNIFSGVGGDTPVMGPGGSGADTPTQKASEEGRAGQPAMPLDPPGPDRKAADLRNDVAEEERRHKLRQVHMPIGSGLLHQPLFGPQGLHHHSPSCLQGCAACNCQNCQTAHYTVVSLHSPTGTTACNAARLDHAYKLSTWHACSSDCGRNQGSCAVLHFSVFPDVVCACGAYMLVS